MMEKPNLRKIGMAAFIIANERLFERLTERFYRVCIDMHYVSSEIIDPKIYPFSQIDLAKLERAILETRMREIFPEIEQDDFDISVTRQVREKYGRAFVDSILAAFHESGLTFVKDASKKVPNRVLPRGL